MRDILAIVYKRKTDSGIVYRLIVHFNKLKKTAWGRDGVEDFPTLYEMIEALKQEVCSTNEKVIGITAGGEMTPHPGMQPANLELSKEVPTDGHFSPGHSDGGNRQPLEDEEFEAAREALQDIVGEWEAEK